jgi:hypothetical protein
VEGCLVSLQDTNATGTIDDVRALQGRMTELKWLMRLPDIMLDEARKQAKKEENGRR